MNVAFISFKQVEQSLKRFIKKHCGGQGVYCSVPRKSNELIIDMQTNIGGGSLLLFFAFDFDGLFFHVNRKDGIQIPCLTKLKPK